MRWLSLVATLVVVGCSGGSGGNTGGGAAGGFATAGGFSGSGGGSGTGGGATGGGLAAGGLAGGGTAGGSMSGGSAAGGTAGAGAGFATLQDLLAAAPLAWQPSGTEVATPSGRVTMVMPTGWTSTAFTNALLLKSPMESNGQCEIFVFEPAAAAATEQARRQQLFDATLSLFPMGTTLYGEFGSADVFYATRRGTWGSGWPFVGLILETQNAASKLEPWLAVFGNEAVAVVPIRPSGTSCLSSAAGELNLLTVMHTLDLDVFQGSANNYAQPILGSWFTSDGNVGLLRAFAANQHYLDVATINGQYVQSGQLYDVNTTFVGDGSYVVYGPVLARFPAMPTATRRNESVLMRLYEESTSSTMFRRECEVKRSVVDNSPYETCLTKNQ